MHDATGEQRNKLKFFDCELNDDYDVNEGNQAAPWLLLHLVYSNRLAYIDHKLKCYAKLPLVEVLSYMLLVHHFISNLRSMSRGNRETKDSESLIKYSSILTSTYLCMQTHSGYVSAL